MAEGQGQKGERAKRSRAEGRKIFRPAAQGQGRKVRAEWGMNKFMQLILGSNLSLECDGDPIVAIGRREGR